MNPLIGIALTLALLFAGSVFVAILDGLALRLIGGRGGPAVGVPLLSAWQLLRQQQTTTERPDALAWTLAPILYFALAATGLALIPVSGARAALPSEVGIVVWGAVEALTIVAVFLHGWSSNSHFPLAGAYRFVAVALSVMLVSMFVLIAAALPAASLAVPAIVESQRDVWNVVRQPLGLPLFLLLGLAISLRGPMDFADARDLAGGTSAEDSGGRRLAWELARLSMLVAFAGISVAIFLGGHHGPLLPGPLWLLLKMSLVLVLMVGIGHFVARADASRLVPAIWTVLLPIAFLDLALAGLVTLL